MSDPLYAGVAAGALGCALFFAGSAVASAGGHGRRSAISRLGSFTEPTPGDPSPGAGRALRRDNAVDKRLTTLRIGAWLEHDLQRAGLAWHTKDYLSLVILAGVIAALIAFVTTGQGLIALGAAAGGFLLPVIIVRRTASTRAVKLNNQVVEVVEIIASSLRAGFGFVQALEFAAREQPEPISGVLARVVHEINIGVSTDDALDRLVIRTSDQDVELVVTAVLIQRRVGGNLAEVLQNISQTIRDRIQVKGQIKTLTAQARMSGWIVALLPVAMAGVLAFLEPNYIGVLFTSSTGHILLVGSVLMDIVGFVAIQRLSKVDY